MVPKTIRLPTSDVNRVLKSGKRWSTPAFRCTALINGQKGNRYAVIVRTKKIKTAVGRAYTKRIIREWLRLYTHTLPQGFDCTIGCTQEITKTNRQEAVSGLQSALCETFSSIVLPHPAVQS